MRAAAAAFLLAAAGHAGHAPSTFVPAPAPVFQPAMPAPLPPPTSPGPGPAMPSSGISPLLLGPGAEPAGPSAPGVPAPIDQQKLQSYRNDLQDQQRSLDRAGVSPADPRYRDIQQRLLQLDNPGSP